jgi:hypothetical protein
VDIDTPTEIWASAVHTLPDIIFKFALSVALNTLPHQKNLFRWKKSDSANCQLCGELQSLLNVLNSCNVSLNHWSYDSRHNIILQRIAGIIEGKLSNFRLIADLLQYPYQRPLFLTSDLRPDILIWNEDLMKLYIIELTVCYDTLAKNAEERKTDNNTWS